MDANYVNFSQQQTRIFSFTLLSLSKSGYIIYIHSDALDFLNNAIQDNYASFNLIKEIVSMRSNPRPLDGGVKKGTVDHRQLVVKGAWVNYFIENGCVYIESIVHNALANKADELAGIHHVKLVRNE